MSRTSPARVPLRLVLGAAAALAFAGAPATAANSAIYKWKDSRGVTHYTNVKEDRSRATDITPVGGNASLGIEPPPAQESRARGGIFKFRDASGVMHYTDKRPVGRNYQVINVYCPACDPRSPINWDRTRLNLTAFADTIDVASKEYGVEPALVRAIIHAESAFNPNAVSRKGAQGLMQLMPATASDYGVYNAFNANENIRAGVRHLAGLLKNYNGDVKMAAAAYNAGAGAVQKYGGVPPYEETRLYVQRVGVLHRRYQTGT